MAVFTFYLHDATHEIPRFEIELLDGREEAIAHGRQLLATRPYYMAVTITEDDAEVARLLRSAA